MDNQSVKTVRVLKWLIAGLVGFSVAVVAFGAGMWVGQQRAAFSFEWADNYHRNFAGPGQGFFGDFPGEDFINPHGVFGTVISVDVNGQILMVKGHDNVEKDVAVSAQTLIRNTDGVIKLSQLASGDSVVIIGSPNDQGQIQAQFIRVLPPGAATSGWQGTIIIQDYGKSI